MNVLALVFAVLMILGLFTHVQLENFKGFYVVKTEYNNFIKQKERAVFNEREERLYRNASSSKGPSKTKPRGKNNSNRNINFRLLLDPEAKEKDQEKYLQHRLMLKDLMILLFQHTAFYKDIDQKRPTFLDELLDRMVQVTKQQEIKTPQEVSKLNLQDDDLQFFYYSMMQGVQKGADKESEKEPVKKVETYKLEETEESEEEPPVADEDEEFEPDTQSISLKNYLHFNPNQKQIKVWLASKELLQVIFQDSNTADAIIAKREELYPQIDKIGKDIATQELEKFKAKKRSDIQDNLLDFQVSKTNPKDYR